MITPEARNATADVLARIRAAGGYPDAPGGPVELGTTLSGIKALAFLGERPGDPDEIAAHIMRAFDPAYGAWCAPGTARPAVLATAGGLLGLKALDATEDLKRCLFPSLRWMVEHAATREEHFMTLAVIDECRLDVRPQRTLDFFRALEQSDGTFGPSPLQNGIAASALLRVGAQLRDPQAVTDLLLRSQLPSGGFADVATGGAPAGSATADLWTTYCVMRALDLLGVAPDVPRLAEWVSRLQVLGGGFGPAGTFSANATYQCLGILDWLAAPVLEAARRGDAERLRQYLAGGGDPDITDLQGWTPLATAAVRGHASVVRLLLSGEHGRAADPDLRTPGADALPIFWAGQSGDRETVAALVEQRPDHLFATSSVNGHTVLLQAAFFGTARHRDLAEWLLDDVGSILSIGTGDADGLDAARRRLLAACNVRGYTPTSMAALWNNQPLLALFRERDTTTQQERDSYREALLAAIAVPEPADPAERAVQLQTDRLLETIATGFAGLDEAARNGGGDAGARDDLLSAVKAAIETPDFDINRRGGPLGQTPVIAALTGTDADDLVGEARLRLTTLLLSHGADPDLPERHPMAVDAVIRAAVLNHFRCLQEIRRTMAPLAFAAALNERPAINGQTALDDTVHRALTASDDTLASHLDQIRWASRHGARTDIADFTGVTVADRARLALDDEVLRRHAPEVLAALGLPADASPAVGSQPRDGAPTTTTSPPGKDVMTDAAPELPLRGHKIAVLMESDFYEPEIFYYQRRFAEEGAEVHFLTRLWGQPALTFHGHEYQVPFEVRESFEGLSDEALREYSAVIVPSGIVADRLRYTDDVAVLPPATAFVARAFAEPSILTGIICHGMWLVAPAPHLVRGRRVVVHNNLHGDAINMGAVYVDSDVVVDGDLITARTGGHAHLFARRIIDTLVQRSLTSAQGSPERSSASESTPAQRSETPAPAAATTVGVGR